MGSFDLAIIGAGPGGYVAAIRAAQLGAKVALIERDAVGGVCLNRGCIPTKALIASAHALETARRAADFGVTNISPSPFPSPQGGEGTEFPLPSLPAEVLVAGGERIKVRGGPAIDMAKACARKDRIVAQLKGGVEKLLRGNRIEVIRGTAAFAGPGKISVDGKAVDAVRILIATGSTWIPLPGLAPNGETIVTTDEALEWTEVPQRLVIVGGGVIGCEFACMMRSFGAEVSIVEATPSILPPVERAVSRLLARAMKAKGIEILTGTTATPSPLPSPQRGEGTEFPLPSRHKNFGGQAGERIKVRGGITLTLSSGEERSADRVLVAVGRRPNTAGLNLDSASVDVDERGFIKADGHFQTTAKDVFAVGDVIGPPMLAHAASAAGIAAVEGMFAGHRSPVTGHGYDPLLCPSPIFTSPEIASVGATSEELQARGIAFTTGRFPYAANGKALCDGDAEGQAIVHADPSSGKILGVHLIGPGATTMIAEAALALKQGLTVGEIAATIHAHPTLPEILAEACEDVEGRAVHKLTTAARRKDVR